ncbi:class IIb bacteriocin, lactobin A/cerein 7B family [Neisseria mucosa]|jgi:class IIb bacteriocin, lactobin A/cerein 7B family|uniref:class IIb bacteriocin, lactobin A/cerein 7B family n=1 Tax=Neisseria mucosa TaxID=488 RepID=UPI00280B98B3|nr:class IIb bacteriocin, lactobin A/cerein 7B family [Neisseria mucosa]
MQVLKSNELEQVSGGWIAHAAGAILGGYAGGYGYLAGGGKNPNGFIASVAGGAAGGIVSPVRGIGMGVRAVAGGLLSAGVNTYLTK